MVKRIREEEIAGVLEFAGLTSEDPDFVRQMQDHKDRNGGKVRVAKGMSGVRVSFSKEADMHSWREWNAKRSRASVR